MTQPQLQPHIDWNSDPGFVIVDGVPILDEHTLHLPADREKGTPAQTLHVNAQVLAQIAANNNRRALETGDTVMLIEGHTRDDAPEYQQPDIVGEADNFRLAPLFNTGRQAIFARFKFRKTPDVLAKLKANKFPRRSVELWTDRWEIDPIALLGATAPERDLGVLRLSRIYGKRVNQDGKLRYELCRVSQRVHYGCGPTVYGAGDPMQPSTTPSAVPMPGQTPAALMGGSQPDPMQPQQTPNMAGPPVDPNMLAAVMQAIQSTDVWQQMQAMMAQMQQMMQMLTGGMGAPGMGASLPGAAPGAVPGAGGPQQGMGGMDPMTMLMGLLGSGNEEGDQGPPQEQRDDEDRLRLQASAPGATNTFIPTGGGGWQMPTTLGLTRDRHRNNPPRTSYMNSYQHTPGATTTPVNGQQNGHVNGVLPQQPVPQQPQQQVPQMDPLQAECIRLQRENAALVQENRQLRVGIELAAIAQEGIEFDAREELPLLVSLDDNQRALHYQRMRVRYKRRGQTQPVQYDRYGQPVHPQQAQLPQPQLPGLAPAPGQQVVPQQYHRTEQPGGPVQPEPLTGEERNAVYEVMAQQLAAGQPEDYQAAVQQVRYGRRRGRTTTGQEPVY